MAAWTIVVGSVVVVLMGFETMASLHTLEMREAIEKFLAEPPGADLGLGVSGVRQVIHVATLVASGCATAAAVLGYQALRRNRPARIGLTVVAVPLFLAGLATGAFFSSLVAAASAMLWLSPAREWYAGTWKPSPAGGSRNRRTPTTSPPPPQPPLPGPPYAGPPYAGPPVSGPPAAGPPVAGPPVAGQPGWAPPPYPVPPPTIGYGAPAPWQPVGALAARPVPRPLAVTLACVLTWVFAGLSLLMLLATMALLTVDSSLLLEEMHRQNPEFARQGIADDMIVTGTYVVGTLLALWSVAALVFAGFAFAGRRWARTALLVCSAGAVILLLLSVVTGQLLLLLPLSAATATTTNLVRADVRAWFAPPPGPRGGMRA